MHTHMPVHTHIHRHLDAYALTPIFNTYTHKYALQYILIDTQEHTHICAHMHTYTIWFHIDTAIFMEGSEFVQLVYTTT